MANILIGIDTGTHTGVAIWDKPNKQLSLYTLPIHKAMILVRDMYNEHGTGLFVRFEDARLRTWFGNAGREQLQGAGSIKRDCTIWEDYLKDLGVRNEAVPPKKNCTKLSADQFKKITGYTNRTSEHSRDAAMLVYNL